MQNNGLNGYYYGFRMLFYILLGFRSKSQAAASMPSEIRQGPGCHEGEGLGFRGFGALRGKDLGGWEGPEWV